MRFLHKKAGQRTTVFRTSLILFVFAFIFTFGTKSAFADTVQVNSGEELDAAIKNAPSGRIIELTRDIDAVSSSTYRDRTHVTIDGKGHTIDGKGLSKTALRFKRNVSVTLKNATMKNLSSSLRYGGGAIGIYTGSLEVENCAFIGNVSTGASGKSNGGGAVLAHSAGANLSVVNSTFYNNSTSGAGGAIFVKGSAAKVSNCTIVDNRAGAYTGGVYNRDMNGKAKVSKCIIVASKVNAGNAGVDLYNFVDDGYNLLGSLNTSLAGTSHAGLTVENMKFADSEPKDNGSSGGSPHTFALSPASLAVDATDSVSPMKDQRGIDRDDAPDIGAYEYEFSAPGVVRKPKATPPAGNYFDSQLSVTLESLTSGAEIRYTTDGSTPGKDSLLYTTPLTFSRTTMLKAVSILNGNSSEVRELKYTFLTETPTAAPSGGRYYDRQKVTLSASEGAAIFYTLDGSTPNRRSLRYTSPIEINRDLTLMAIAYIGNEKESAVLRETYKITLPVEVSVNSGLQLDLAIRAARGDELMIISLAKDIDAISSSTYEQGVRILIDGRGHTIDGKGVDNTALRFKRSADDVKLRNLTLRNMKTSAWYGGGAIGFYKGDLEIENCAFIDNNSTGASGLSNGGGAVLTHGENASLSVVNSTFYGNQTTGSGGAILAKGGSVDIVNCTIVANSADEKGGGLYNSESDRTGLYNSIVAGNKARNGDDDTGNASGDHNLTGDVARLMLDLSEGQPQDNGGHGGSPYTVALLRGSPAIGGADVGRAPKKDQRGFQRDDSPDIGAFEFVAGDNGTAPSTPGGTEPSTPGGVNPPTPQVPGIPETQSAGQVSTNPVDWNISMGVFDPSTGLTRISIVTNLFLDDEPTKVRAIGTGFEGEIEGELVNGGRQSTKAWPIKLTGAVRGIETAAVTGIFYTVKGSGEERSVTLPAGGIKLVDMRNVTPGTSEKTSEGNGGGCEAGMGGFIPVLLAAGIAVLYGKRLRK